MIKNLFLLHVLIAALALIPAGRIRVQTVTVLHSFTVPDFGTNTDGARPSGKLVANSPGDTVYGTTSIGGSLGFGTVFALQTDGTGFTTLHSFNNYSDGGEPADGLVLSGNILYGTAHSYGSSGQGTVFGLSFRPQLTITASSTNVILLWPTNIAGFDYTGYTLLSTTNLSPTAVWTTNSPGPVVVNGQNTVTISASGARQLFRLGSQ